MLERKRTVTKTYQRKKARLSEPDTRDADAATRASKSSSSHSTANGSESSEDDAAVSASLVQRKQTNATTHKLSEKAVHPVKAKRAAQASLDETEWDEQVAASHFGQARTGSQAAKARAAPARAATSASKHPRPSSPKARAASVQSSAPRLKTPEPPPPALSNKGKAKMQVLSPARDLSNVFKRYLDGSAAPDESDNDSDQTQRQGSTRVVSALGARKNLKSPSGSSLLRSHSMPGSFSPAKSVDTAASNEDIFSSPARTDSETLLVPASPSRHRSGMTSTRPANGLKRTYGGPRTFISDQAQDDLLQPLSDLPMQASSSRSATTANASTIARPPRVVREAYSALRERWGADKEELMADGELKSAVQMKARGENARLTDESAYLLEGLESDHPTDLKRTSAIELLRKLSKEDFRRRIKASGLVENIYVALRRAGAGDGDAVRLVAQVASEAALLTDREQILDACLALMLCLLCADQRVAEPLMRISHSQMQQTSVNDGRGETSDDDFRCDILVVLRVMASKSTASTSLVKIKASKSETRMLKDVLRLVEVTSVLSHSDLPLTLRSMCILAVSAIASFTPRAIFRPQDLICTSGTLDFVAASLVAQVPVLEERIARFETGLDLVPTDGSLSLSVLDMHLRVVESCLELSDIAFGALSKSMQDLASAFQLILLVCEIALLQRPPIEEARSSAMDCTLSILQILIDLTTTSPLWSACLAEASLSSTLIRLIAFARRVDGAEKVESDESSRSHSFDCLCLSLGVLTNMAESVDRIKSDVSQNVLGPNCPLDKRCARLCRCHDAAPMLDRLISLYLHDLGQWGNEINTSFLSGYSAILLGLLMLDSNDNTQAVEAALKDYPDKRRALLEAMSEFADLHDKNDESRHAEGDGQDSQSSLARRIRALLANM